MTLYDHLLRLKVPMHHVTDLTELASVRVALTGPQGGDAGHGGRTLVELDNDGMACEVHIRDMSGNTWVVDNPSLVRIVVGGDWEYGCLSRLLHAAAGLLRNDYVPCLHTPEPLCRHCAYQRRLQAGEVDAKSMPCRALMRRWEEAEEAEERAIDEAEARMEQGSAAFAGPPEGRGEWPFQDG